MFVVTVHFEIKPDSLQPFLPLMSANARASINNEIGCHQFDVCTDPSRPNSVFLYEVYDDEAAFKTHMQQPHFIAFDAETSDMIATKTVATFVQVTR